MNKEKMSVCAFAGTHFLDYGYSICKLRHQHSIVSMENSIEIGRRTLDFYAEGSFLTATWHWPRMKGNT